MAKKGKKSAGPKRSMLTSPLYATPDGYELGAHRVEGPKGAKSVPDPLGLGHGTRGHGPSTEHLKQSHDKD